MATKNIGEFELIRRISRGCVVRPHGVVLGIGDDAAAVSCQTDQHVLLTTDMLIENVHFICDATTPFKLGYKALAVNLSDIAAMGGVARDAFVSIAIPDRIETAYVEELYAGLKSLAAEFDVNLLGGDTTGSMHDLVINVTVLGFVSGEQMLRRDAARAGDRIFTTGYLGDSRAGLHLLQHNIIPDTKDLQYLIDAHLKPRPMLHEGRFLAKHSGVHAAIDISDGLSSDLMHILEASHLGALLQAAQLPISPSLKAFCRKYQFDPTEFILSGGEDYVLLITVAPTAAEDIAAAYQKQFQMPLYLLGEITTSNRLEIATAKGGTQSLNPTGWDHFGNATT